MIEVRIKGWGDASLEYPVLDFNGTLAYNGQVSPGIKPRLKRLARSLQVHVLTADTFWRAARALRTYPCAAAILQPLHHVGGHKPSGAQSLAHSWG
jgi:hypothetical protein